MAEQNEYLIAVGKGAIADLWAHHDKPDAFNPSKFSESDIKVFTRKSEDAACPEDIVKASFVLEGTSTNHVLALVLPWMSYRLEWDDLLSGAEVVQELTPSMKVVHHLTRKRMPLSARDSIDVVAIDARSDTVIAAARSVNLDSVPEVKDHVRTSQHLGGYVIKDLGEGKIQFEMYFHGDLKIGGISLVKSLIETIKPKIMVDLAKNLRKSIKKVPVLPADMESTLIYTDLVVEAN
ncbi:unnamed protein product, partial [Mesorhabditis spiculigera]